MNYNESSEDYLESILMLTDEGAKIARHTYTRHKVLTNFFESIGVGHNNAEADACKIEHDISDETFKRLKEHMHRLQELDISPKAASLGSTSDTD